MGPALLPAEAFADSGMAELHPGRTPVMAVPGTRRDFQPAEKRVHLGDGEDAPGPHRAVAGDGRGDEIELLAKADRTAELGDLGCKVGKKARDVGLAEHGRHRPDEHRRRAESLELEAEIGEVAGGAFEAVAVWLVQVDDLWKK